MPTKHCSFAKCTSDNRYPKENVFFIPFIKPHIDKVRCIKWIHASRRVDLTVQKINKYTYVCSKHFIGGKGPTEENPDPVSATISKIPKARMKRPSTSTIDSPRSPLQNLKKGKNVNAESSTIDSLCSPLQKLKKEKYVNAVSSTIDSLCSPLQKLKKEKDVNEESSTIDSLCSPLQKLKKGKDVNAESSTIDSLSSPLQKLKKEKDVNAESSTIDSLCSPLQKLKKEKDVNAESSNLIQKKDTQDVTLDNCLTPESTESPKSNGEHTNKSVAHEESQTCIEVESIFVIKLKKEIEKVTKKLSTSTLNYESCMNDHKKFKFYTGLMPEDFDIVWNFLGPPTESSLRIWHSRSGTNKRITIKQFKALSLKNQLFLTLVRSRCSFLLYDLSCRFGISMSYISKITTTWIQLMYCKFKQLNHFPSAKDVSENLPQAFKKFKNIRVIIDCFLMEHRKAEKF